MFWSMYDCGVPVKHLLYPRLTHADFVTAWRPLRQDQVGDREVAAAIRTRAANGFGSLGDFAEDLMDILSEKKAIQYETK